MPGRRFTIQPVWFNPDLEGYEPQHEELFPFQFPYEWAIETFPVGHPDQGKPKFNFNFCAVEGPKTSLLNVPSTMVFPEYPLDGVMSGMDSAEQTAMVQNAEAYVFTETLNDHVWNGVTTPGTNNLHADIPDQAMSYREYLDTIVKQMATHGSIDELEL